MASYGVHFQPQVSDDIKHGFNLIADLVAPTLGPHTGVVANQRFTHLAPEILDDAGTIVRRVIELHETNANIGAMMMRSLIWKTSDQSGDFGATTAIIARAIFNEGYKLLQAGAISYNELRLGLKSLLETVEVYLRSQAVPLCTEDELAHTALSATDDAELAQVLGEIAYLLGPDAYVMVEKHPARGIERVYVEGAYFPAKVPANHFYLENRQVVLSNARILLIDQPLKSIEDVPHILRWIDAKSPLVVITYDIDPKVLTAIIGNSDKRQLSLVQLTLPEVERIQAFEDLHLLTGAQVMSTVRGLPLSQLKQADFGQVTRLEANQDTLVIIPQRTGRDAVRPIVEHLRGVSSKSEKVQRRLASLEGRLCRLWIGATSDAEREARLALAKRGLKIVTNALRGGVVAGGGAELYRASFQLGDSSADPLSQRVLQAGLRAPLHQLLQNAGHKETVFVLDALGESNTVYNIKTNTLTPVAESGPTAGPLDSVNALVRALEIAVSGALMALSTDVIIYHRQPKRAMEP